MIIFEESLAGETLSLGSQSAECGIDKDKKRKYVSKRKWGFHLTVIYLSYL